MCHPGCCDIKHCARAAALADRTTREDLEQVEPAVAIVVYERTAGAIADSRSGKTGFSCGLDELLAPVLIKAVVAIISDQQIGFAVIVVVAHAHTLRPAFDGEARVTRNICKFTLAVIMVKLQRARRTRGCALEGGPVGDQDVVRAIAVIIEDRGAVAGRLQDVGLSVFPAESVGQVQSRIGRDIDQPDGYRGAAQSADTQQKQAQRRKARSRCRVKLC